jgi:FkbM family methyltransferase
MRKYSYAHLIRKSIAGLPIQSRFYSFCKSYCNLIDGENNDEMETNGELRYVKSQIKDCFLIFDVGANQGKWTERVLRYNRNAIIHCFEPVKSIYDKLVERFPDNVICNNVGLSSECCYRDIYLEVLSVYKRSGLRAGWGIEDPQKTETIILETLDGYCEKKGIQEIDFLKLDVEGHELEVFRGGIKMLNRGKIKRIQFEYGGCNIDARALLKDIFKLFDGLDYVFYKILPGKLVKIHEYDQRIENFQYKNFALLHKTIEIPSSKYPPAKPGAL